MPEQDNTNTSTTELDSIALTPTGHADWDSQRLRAGTGDTTIVDGGEGEEEDYNLTQEDAEVSPDFPKKQWATKRP
jgi:hypothetical protein